MSTRPTQSAPPIQVNASDDRKVVFTPDDEDRFMLTCKEAIQAVQHGMSAAVFLDEVKAIYAYLKDWSDSRSARIKMARPFFREGHIVFFVVPEADCYDFSLADDLTDLDINLAEKFRLMPCEVRQIPSCFPEAEVPDDVQ